MTKIMHSGKKQNNRQKNSILEENLAGLALLKLSGTVAAPPGALPSLPPIYRAGHRMDDSHHLPSPAVPWTQRLQCWTVPWAPSVLSDRGSRARSPGTVCPRLQPLTLLVRKDVRVNRGTEVVFKKKKGRCA